MLRLYTADDTPGFQVSVPHTLSPAESRRDPLVVLVLAILFIGSVVCLHLTQNFFRCASLVLSRHADARRWMAK